MIKRHAMAELRTLLGEFPVVALLGPRQVGKTTLAHQLIRGAGRRQSVYLDLESPADRARLADAEAYLDSLRGRLVVLDEVHRVPALFEVLRVIVDRRRPRTPAGQFLVLGSASLDLLRQSSESLAGRIGFLELAPVRLDEIRPGGVAVDQLWLRGGFPDSLLARDDAASLRWRQAFIRTYLERDVPMLGPRIPAETLRRFWTMLAHTHGQPLNAARLAAALGVSGQTVARYLDLLVDLLLVRRLPAWAANAGKRLVRAPKVFLRDSGIAHALLGIETLDDLLAHPVAGASWEGLVLESLIAAAGDAPCSYYRTAAGAEIDLVVEGRRRCRLAIEVKRSLAPSVSKGFRVGCADLSVIASAVVYPGTERFPLGGGTTAIGAPDAIGWLRRHLTRG
jgi:predicted AAA+ superfamily ATPase